MFKSISGLWIGSLAGSGSTFLVYMILSRNISLDQFGIFGSTIAIANMAIILSGFGISQLWLKIFGKEGWEGVRWISPSIILLMLTTSFSLALLFFWIRLGPHDDITQRVYSIFMFYIIGQVCIQFIYSKLQLEENYRLISVLNFLPNFLRLLLIIIVVYIFKKNIDLHIISYIFSLVGILLSILAFIAIFRMINGQFNLKGHPIKRISEKDTPKVANVFFSTLPFGLAAIFAFIYIQSDLFMIKYLVGNEEAAYYNVVYIIIATTLVLPIGIFQKFFLPKYHRWANYDLNKLFSIYKKGNLIMLIIGSLISLIIYFSASLFIPVLFGDSFTRSIILLKAIIIIIPMYFVSYSVGAILMTKDYMKMKIYIMGLAALINIILNCILIPRFMAVGAIIATLTSNLVLLSLYYYVSEKIIFKNINKYDAFD